MICHLLSKRALVAAGAMRTVMHGLDEVLASGRARQFELKLVVAASVGEARRSGARAAAGGAHTPLARGGASEATRMQSKFCGIAMPN